MREPRQWRQKRPHLKSFFRPCRGLKPAPPAPFPTAGAVGHPLPALPGLKLGTSATTHDSDSLRSALLTVGFWYADHPAGGYMESRRRFMGRLASKEEPTVTKAVWSEPQK